MTPLISVIMPFYQAERHIEAAISSVVAQSFDRWELILVDNNATDGSGAIARQWAERDRRIRLAHEPGQGIARALNRGLRHAGADLIARMDADDYSAPRRLEIQFRFMKENPSIDVVSARTAISSDIEDHRGFLHYMEWQNGIITPEDHALNRFIESPVAHPTVLFHRYLVDLYGPYDSGNVPEDYELWLRWMERGARFYKIPEVLLTWRDHGERLSRIHPNYSKEAFFNVKCLYLARWIDRNIGRERKIIVCGAGNICRRRAALLEELGIPIYGYTDIRERRNREIVFIPYEELAVEQGHFIVNFISKRGVRDSIRRHLNARGFVEGRDFILAA